MRKKSLKFLIKTPKLPKWAWWVLWFVGILMSLYIISVGSFQIWVSTWQTYKNDEFGFSLKVPKGWDIKDPRKDTSDTQYVYDYGSILKIGDQNTDFSQNADGSFSYKGSIIIYLYPARLSTSSGLQVLKIGKDGISKDFAYTDSKKTFNIRVTISDTKNMIYKILFRAIEEVMVNSFRVSKN